MALISNGACVAIYDSKKVMRVSFVFPALPSNGVIVAGCIGALEISG